jgi:hypothetical protein
MSVANFNARNPSVKRILQVRNGYMLLFVCSACIRSILSDIAHQGWYMGFL